MAKGDAHHAEPLVCEASAATLEVLARHAPLRVLACGAATQAFASLAERCAHPGLRAARRSLLDLLWFGVACAPSVAEKHALVDALPPTGEAMAALERLALGDEEAEADDALLDEMGIETGIDIRKMMEIACDVEDTVGRDLPGQVMKAGLRLDLHDMGEVATAKG